MKHKLLFIVPFILAFCLCFIISEKDCNYALSGRPDKPLPFNHKTHLNHKGTDCETCHAYYDNGRFSGIPEAGKCKSCHESPWPGNNNKDPGIIGITKGLEKYGETDKPWGSYAGQPGHVYFSHKAVMATGKIKCEKCHELKKESTGTKKLKGRMSMDECEECHTSLGLSNKCTVCHD